VSTTPVANLPPVSTTSAVNNGNNIRLQTPENELEGKNLYVCFLSYPKVTKKFEMVLMEYSVAGGKLIHEKNQKQTHST
jgi:hypothetical protein